MILNFLKGFRGAGGKRKQTNFRSKILDGTKLHTIRWDVKNRWYKGRKIHFSTGARTLNYECFKEGICTGTQQIEILGREVWVDNQWLSEDMVHELAINDGFDNIEDFWAWFDQYSPFLGKIIHWTNIRY